jgi:hypothetical protein
VELWGVKKKRKIMRKRSYWTFLSELTYVFFSRTGRRAAKAGPEGHWAHLCWILWSFLLYLQQKFDWPTTSLYRQEFGWRKHQDIGLQSGKLAINVQVISHLHFNVYRVLWCLRHANNCIDACGLLLFARPDRFLFCRVQC